MISIVIPVFNRISYTKACLESLSEQTDKRFEVVVVDDGSTDGTSEYIRNNFPEITLLTGDGNLWWTGATNLGIRYALSRSNVDYIMTLNNDTLPTPNFIEKMMYWAERSPKSLLGALAIEQGSGKEIYGGEIIDWKNLKYNSLLDNLNPQQRVGLQEVTHFPGRGLLIPTEVFEKIGLFEENLFPHYAADYDFTFQARKAGFKVFCNYDAKLLIFPEASGSVALRSTKSIRSFKNHLFSRKGGGNLKVFTDYILRNCPKKYIPRILLEGYFRRLIGYWIH